MFRGSVKGTGYPLHSPVSPSFPHPCVTVCHHISTGLYLFADALLCEVTDKGKGTAITLQAWTASEDSRRMILPDFKTIGTCRW